MLLHPSVCNLFTNFDILFMSRCALWFVTIFLSQLWVCLFWVLVELSLWLFEDESCCSFLVVVVVFVDPKRNPLARKLKPREGLSTYSERHFETAFSGSLESPSVTDVSSSSSSTSSSSSPSPSTDLFLLKEHENRLPSHGQLFGRKVRPVCWKKFRGLKPLSRNKLRPVRWKTPVRPLKLEVFGP